MANLSAASLAYVYFVYGLAFCSMGMAVLLELGRTSELRFARPMPWLAAFGFIHGGHEWFEMFETLGLLPPGLPVASIRLVALVVSFSCLAAFGISLNRPVSVSPMVSMWRTIVLIGVCLLGLGVMRSRLSPVDWPAAANAWARYSLGVAGAVITSLALVAQGRAFAKQGMAAFGQDLLWAAAAFTLYGVVGQVFATKSVLPPSNVLNADLFLRLFGIPVQLFRAAMGVIVAVAMIRALRVFESESAQRLKAAQAVAMEAERRVQRETAQLNLQLQEAVSELSVLFEMSRILAVTTDWQALLTQAATRVVDLLPARAAMIVLGGDEPGLVASAGFETGECSDLAEAALAASREAACRSGAPEMQVSDQMIVLPLQAKRGLIGSLALCPQDVQKLASKRSLLLTLGRELAIAIENARLYQQVQEREVLRGELLRRSVEAQEEERKRIARELHDEIGQVITA